MHNNKHLAALPAAGRWAAAAAAVLALWGCGGGGGDGGSAAAMQACLQPTNAGGVVVGSGLPGDPAIPEPQSGYKTGKRAVQAGSYMAVTANPLATQAACETLRDGGTAVDAAVAAQMVLGLVEPQSSGLGGGGFLVHYNAATGRVQTYDGRETAPAAATENYLRHISATDTSNPLPNLGNSFASTRASGRSIGVPGAVRMLELAHQDHGRTPWASLFQPGIRLASDGFAISGRMAAAIAGARTDLLRDPDATAYFLNADLTPRALGSTIRNPAYAETLRAIASGGANAFYTGPIAQSIVDKVKVTSGGVGTATVAITPGLMELSDLAGYRAIRREPVCISYRDKVVCGMGPPSSGGIAVAQALGILETFDLASMRPTTVTAEGAKPSVMAVHLVSEAQRLAYADRNRYVADTDFVALPGSGLSSLLDRAYLRQRAGLISTTRSMGTATAGEFGAARMGSSAHEGNGTTHLSIVDRWGNAVAFTTTIEAGMGSFHFTRGFLLNNQLTDFSFDPSDATGPIANRIQAGKRPRSSMAPTIVFNRTPAGGIGDLYMVTGSPGGAAIIQFVTKTLVGAIDWGLDAQQATSMPNFGAANSPTTGIGGEHPLIDATNNGNADTLVTGLRALGHTVSVAAQSSGVSTIIRKPPTTPIFGRPFILEGGADPRREGIALGDPVR